MDLYKIGIIIWDIKSFQSVLALGDSFSDSMFSVKQRLKELRLKII